MDSSNIHLPPDLPSMGSLLHTFSFMDYFHQSWSVFRRLSKTTRWLCDDKFNLFRRLAVCETRTIVLNSGKYIKKFRKYLDYMDLFELNLDLQACLSQILQRLRT